MPCAPTFTHNRQAWRPAVATLEGKTTQMPRFSEIAKDVVTRHSAHDLGSVLEALGPDVASEVDELTVPRRAALVDQLVRNLRGLSVAHGPTLERALLTAVGAEPAGSFRWDLSSATSLVNVRSGLKYLATWLGYDWAELSRIQAVVCGVARWVQSSSQGALIAIVEPAGVRLQFHFSMTGFDAKTVESSPFISALRDVALRLSVEDDVTATVVTFILPPR